MVIGCCGAGKSTFSKKLHDITGLNLVHLDQLYWLPNWTEPPKDKWAEIVARASDEESWIMDGNYGGTMNIRLARADTVIYLDYPTTRCLWRITKRIIKYHGERRPDMPEGCNERFDLDFYHYVATYNLLRRKRLLQMVKDMSSEKSVKILRNDREVDAYLSSL